MAGRAALLPFFFLSHKAEKGLGQADRGLGHGIVLCCVVRCYQMLSNVIDFSLVVTIVERAEEITLFGNFGQ